MDRQGKGSQREAVMGTVVTFQEGRRNPRSTTAVVLTKEPSLQELVGQFLATQDVAPSSRETYRWQLRYYCRWVQDTARAHRLTTLQREDLLAYKTHLLQNGKSASTITSYLGIVRKLWGWLEAQQLAPNIAKDVRGMKKARGFRKDCLTPAQIRETLAAIDRSTLEGMRNYALFNLLVRTGLRTIEVARAIVGDLRHEGGETILWVQGKGRTSKDDFVLLVEETLSPLRAYLAMRGSLPESAPLFASLSTKNAGQSLTTRSLRRIIKASLRGIGLNSPRLSTHSLRHTAVSLAIQGGASILQAQAMARHADPKTTMLYVHNLERVREGAERYIRF